MPRPPSLADALLRRVLPPEDAEAIAGDLEEMFHTAAAAGMGPHAARRWYWRQVLSVVLARLTARLRSADPVSPDASPKNRISMAAFRQDLSYALRAMRKQPGFTATAVVMLALGIGANVAIFSLVNALLLKPLPFAEPAQLMLAHLLGPEMDSPNTFRQFVWSYPKYLVFRDNQRVFESTAAFGSSSWNVTGTGSPERLSGELVESTYFHTLGIEAPLGRTFTADEARTPGSAPLAVLGHAFWTSRFAADPAVLGRTLGLNGVPHTIVGVLPRGFRGLTGQADVWVPITTLSAAELGERWNHSYYVVARRRAEVTEDQAVAAVRLLGGVVAAQVGQPSGRSGVGWSATAVALDDERVDPIIRRSVLLLLAAVVSLLLIVCINLANLVLVRGLARQREMAIRVALGASRLRVVRQLMTENGLLALLGAAAGLAVAYAAVTGAAAVLPDLRMLLPRGQRAGLTRLGLGRLGLDMTTLLFTAATAAGAALLFGLAPAWRASRRDLVARIKAGSAGALARGTRAFSGRNLLVIGEMALALVLLTAGGLMLKSFARLQATELGFQPDSVLSVRLSLPAPKYNAQRGTQLLEQLLTKLDGRADVESAAYGSCAPLQGGCNMTTATFPDRPAASGGEAPLVGVLWASTRYFDTLGIRLVRGRPFTDRDRVGLPKVVIVNETAARTFWGDADPIGKRIGVGQGGFQDGGEVVGVVADVRYGAVERAVTPDVYLPLLQSLRAGGVIFARGRHSAESMASMLRGDVQALDPDLPLTDVRLMEERFDEATWRTRISAWLLGVFATLALLLAALGTYGVMAQGVEQRRREIGVRMALGAGRRDILNLVIGRALAIALAGIGLGVALAVPAMKLLAALLYQVRPDDPWVFVLLSLMLLTVTLLAGYIPARRAARVDPLATLRAE